MKIKKRIILFVVIAIVFLSIFQNPFPYVSANEGLNLYIQNREEAQNLIDHTAGQLPEDYRGYCGQYTHDLLAISGITTYGSASYNGKDWYPAYRDGDSGNILCDNWTYECFDGKDSLRQMLEKYNGTVYNFVVSMESGSEYGHVFFVNAIVNDTVYFSESFPSLNEDAKSLICVSVDEFYDYYYNSNYFTMDDGGGVIHFYEKDFYRPIITFNDKEQESQTYVFEYQNEKLNEKLYQDYVNGAFSN